MVNYGKNPSVKFDIFPLCSLTIFMVAVIVWPLRIIIILKQGIQMKNEFAVQLLIFRCKVVLMREFPI